MQATAAPTKIATVDQPIAATITLLNAANKRARTIGPWIVNKVTATNIAVKEKPKVCPNIGYERVIDSPAKIPIAVPVNQDSQANIPKPKCQAVLPSGEISFNFK